MHSWVRELAELEIAAAVAPAARKATPLFGPSVGDEFTHSQLDGALELMLIAGAGVEEAHLKRYSVHSFRVFAACALLAVDTPRGLIKRMLRWRGDESLEVYARVNDDVWGEWVGKSISATVDSTIASRLPVMDFSEETQKRFNEIALAMLTMNASTARVALSPL